MNIEQERAAFEAWYEREYSEAVPCGFSPHGYYLDARVQLLFRCWGAARAALQSQDLEVIIEALEAAQNNLGPCRPFGSSDPDSDYYDHDAFMWDYYQRAIDHARRVEGGEDA